jgi:hypothetical protein
MPREEQNIRFHLTRGRKHQIPLKKRRKTSNSMSREEENTRFHVRRARKHQIPFKKRKKTSRSI